MNRSKFMDIIGVNTDTNTTIFNLAVAFWLNKSSGSQRYLLSHSDTIIRHIWNNFLETKINA